MLSIIVCHLLLKIILWRDVHVHVYCATIILLEHAYNVHVAAWSSKYMVHYMYMYIYFSLLFPSPSDWSSENAFSAWCPVLLKLMRWCCGNCTTPLPPPSPFVSSLSRVNWACKVSTSLPCSPCSSHLLTSTLPVLLLWNTNEPINRNVAHHNHAVYTGCLV